MKKALWIVLISLLTLGLLAGCAAPAAESGPAKVRIGTQPWIGYEIGRASCRERV